MKVRMYLGGGESVKTLDVQVASLKESDARQPIGRRDCLAIAALVDVRVTGTEGTMMPDDAISYRATL